MKEYEREILLERIGRESATVGADIPDRIDVQGEEIDLRTFVFEIKRRDTIPAGERERVERAKKNLRRERLQRKQAIENTEEGSPDRSDSGPASADDEITFEEGEEIAAAIIGIDRALNALESLGTTDIEAEEQRNEAADTKRWMNFLKQALGRDNGPRLGGR
jgi:hypothetical protein